jgi:hypothetical protein
MATESSVVVALREVRRLELERQRREEEARQLAMEEDRAREAQQASIQYGQGMAPYGNGNGNGHGHNGAWANGHPNGDMHPESYAHPMRRTSEVVPLAAQANGYGDAQGYVHVPGAVWESPPQQVVRRGSSFKAVLATLIVCGAAAGAGWVKMKDDFGKQLSMVQAEQQKISDARSEAVAARSKTEQELKLRVTELENKLAVAQSKAAAASAALAATGGAKPADVAVGAGAAHKPGGKAGRIAAWKARQGRLAAAKVARAAAAAAPKPEPVAPPAAKSPKLAKKKAVSDDPLGGLKL